MSDPNEETATGPEPHGFLNLGRGWVPLEYLICVKAIDPNGAIKYREMTSQSLHPVEALGMLTTMGDTMRRRLMSGARNVGDWEDE